MDVCSLLTFLPSASFEHPAQMLKSFEFFDFPPLGWCQAALAVALQQIVQAGLASFREAKGQQLVKIDATCQEVKQLFINWRRFGCGHNVYSRVAPMMN